MSRFGNRLPPSPAVASGLPPSPPVAERLPPSPASEPGETVIEPESDGEVLFLVLSDVVQNASPDTQIELASALTQQGQTYRDLPRKVRKLFEKAGEMLWEDEEEDDDDEEDEEDDDE